MKVVKLNRYMGEQAVGREGGLDKEEAENREVKEEEEEEVGKEEEEEQVEDEKG